MAQATFHFPRGFMWGAATSAHQVEGNNFNNNWWAWEQRPGKVKNGHKSGLACDWQRGRWKEDFDRAAAGGMNAQRISVEWARVQPAPGRWDEAAIDRYREMVRGLHERGMLPLVTLHHYSDPLWFEEGGGWENPDSAALFAVYVRKVVEALKEYVGYWATINEPNALAAHAYLLGEFPPGKRDLRLTLQVFVNLIRAHAAAYQAIHAIQPAALAGITLLTRPFQAARNWSPLDRLAAGLLNSAFNDLMPRAMTSGKLRLSAWRADIPEARNTLDFLGVDYYTREQVSFVLDPAQAFARRCSLPGLEATPSGLCADDPHGFYEALKWACSFDVPVIVTENGIEDAEDSLRPRFLLQHLHQLWRLVNENYPIKGYFHWSLVDNFEWNFGWTAPFGLWELDVESQARRKRPSADLYGEICRENGLSSEMVARYAPELLETLFPG